MFTLLLLAAGLYEQALKAYSEDRYEDAARLLQQAARESPRRFQVRFLFGASLVRLERHAEAARELETAHSLNPAHADAAKLLAIEWMRLSRFADAADVLRERPDEESYLLRIEALIEAGDAEGSFRLAQRAAERFPDSARVNCWIGFELREAGRFDEAGAYLQKALRIDANDAAAHALLGGVLLKQEQYEQAALEFRVALRAVPRDVEAAIGLSRALAELERIDEALAALQSSEGDHRIHLERSRLYAKAGNAAAAREQAEIARRLRQRRETKSPAGLRVTE